MDTIERAISRLAEDDADRDFMLRSAGSERDLPSFYNALSLEIARQFMEGILSFDRADAVINTVYALWIGDESIQYPPEPAYSIYLAFDAGEFSVDGSDSVERYTKPDLRRILDGR